MGQSSSLGPISPGTSPDAWNTPVPYTPTPIPMYPFGNGSPPDYNAMSYNMAGVANNVPIPGQFGNPAAPAGGGTGTAPKGGAVGGTTNAPGLPLPPTLPAPPPTTQPIPVLNSTPDPVDLGTAIDNAAPGLPTAINGADGTTQYYHPNTPAPAVPDFTGVYGAPAPVTPEPVQTLPGLVTNSPVPAPSEPNAYIDGKGAPPTVNPSTQPLPGG